MKKLQKQLEAQSELLTELLRHKTPGDYLALYNEITQQAARLAALAND